MYKKAAIITLIVAPLIVDLASRAGSGDAPPAKQNVMAPPENVSPQMTTAPDQPAPPPQTAMTGDPAMPMMSTDPVLDTTPQMAMGAGAEPAPPPPAPQAPTPETTTPVASEVQNPGS